MTPFMILAYFENRAHLALAGGSNQELENLGQAILRQESPEKLIELTLSSSKIAQTTESSHALIEPPMKLVMLPNEGFLLKASKATLSRFGAKQSAKVLHEHLL